jgi:hypothetical protein
MEENKNINIELELLKHRTQCSNLFLLKKEFAEEMKEVIAFIKTRASKGLVLIFIGVFGLLLALGVQIIYANFDLYRDINKQVETIEEETKSKDAEQDKQIEISKVINAQILDALEDIKIELKAMRQDRISDLKNNKVSVKGGSNDSNSR